MVLSKFTNQKLTDCANIYVIKHSIHKLMIVTTMTTLTISSSALPCLSSWHVALWIRAKAGKPASFLTILLLEVSFIHCCISQTSNQYITSYTQQTLILLTDLIRVWFIYKDTYNINKYLPSTKFGSCLQREREIFSNLHWV